MTESRKPASSPPLDQLREAASLLQHWGAGYVTVSGGQRMQVLDFPRWVELEHEKRQSHRATREPTDDEMRAADEKLRKQGHL